MSIMRCDHHGNWDSDIHEECPRCLEEAMTTQHPLIDYQQIVNALEGGIGALNHYRNALNILSEIKDGKTLFEGSPTKDPDCFVAWQNLNVAGKKAEMRLELLQAAIPLARSLISEVERLRKDRENREMSYVWSAMRRTEAAERSLSEAQAQMAVITGVLNSVDIAISALRTESHANLQIWSNLRSEHEQIKNALSNLPPAIAAELGGFMPPFLGNYILNSRMDEE